MTRVLIRGLERRQQGPLLSILILVKRKEKRGTASVQRIDMPEGKDKHQKNHRSIFTT